MAGTIGKKLAGSGSSSHTHVTEKRGMDPDPYQSHTVYAGVTACRGMGCMESGGGGGAGLVLGLACGQLPLL